MIFFTLDGRPVDMSMTRADTEALLSTVEDRLVNAMRDDPPAVYSLHLQCQLIWSLLNPEMFYD